MSTCACPPLFRMVNFPVFFPPSPALTHVTTLLSITSHAFALLELAPDGHSWCRRHSFCYLDLCMCVYISSLPMYVCTYPSPPPAACRHHLTFHRGQFPHSLTHSYVVCMRGRAAPVPAHMRGDRRSDGRSCSCVSRDHRTVGQWLVRRS